MPVAPIVEREGQLQSFGAPSLSYQPEVKGIGAGLENVGRQLEGIAKVAKERGDTVALLDASTSLDTWEQQNLYSKDGAFSKKGKNAIGLPDALGNQFDTDMQGVGKNLANDEQRIAFQKLVQSRRGSIMQTLHSHERKEMDDYGKSVKDGAIASSLDRAEANFDNEPAVQESVAQAQAKYQAWAETQGLSDDEIQANKTDIAEKGYLRALGKKAVTDPEGFLDSIKEGADIEQLSTKPGQARGIRNNNPGNLRDSKDDWQGKSGVDDKGFVKFGSAEDGLRALGVNLKNQQAKHGLTTLDAIIEKYAPNSENDTEAYQKQAAQALGIKGDAPINLQDERMLAGLMTFIVKKENGNQPYPQGAIDRAATIALSGTMDKSKEFQVADASGMTVPDGAPKTMTDVPTGGPVVPSEKGATDSSKVKPTVMTGNKMFDALPFQYQAQLMRLAEGQASKQRVQFRADVEKRSKDALAMAQDGMPTDDIAPSESEFVKAYGYDDGPQKFQEFNQLHGVATAINEVAIQTPAQQAKTLAENKPEGGEGYAAKDAKYKVLETAVVQANKARNADPIGFAQRYGIAPNEPLALNNQKKLAEQLPVRAVIADQMHKDYGTPLAPLTTSEAAGLSQALGKMTPVDQLAYLQNFKAGLTDPRLYTAAISQIRPDSPVTAVAGAFVGLDGQQVVEENTFSANKSITPMSVAQRLIEGEALLNPTKFDKGEDGKPSSGKVFPMPPDGNDDSSKGLRPEFNTYVGDAFRGMPELENVAYQSYRAYYAAEAARRGVYGGLLDDTIAKEAARAVVGTVVEKNSKNVLAPWGMDETDFLDTTKEDFDSIVKEQGLDPKKIKWDDIGLQNTGNPGEYWAQVGVGYLTNKDGQKLIISARKK